MKKISVLTIVMLFAVSSFAQNMNVQTAYNYLKKGKLSEALKAIEPALKHAQTAEHAKTWFYYAGICSEIANSKDAKYKDLLDDPLAEALKGYQKVVEFERDQESKNLTESAVSAMDDIARKLSEKDANETLKKYPDKRIKDDSKDSQENPNDKE